MPTSWLFSTWNCVPARLPAATIATTGPPYSVVAMRLARDRRRAARSCGRNRRGRRAPGHPAADARRARNPARSSPSAAAAARAPSISAISPAIQPKPGVTCVLQPALGHQLHADADAEERGAARRSRSRSPRACRRPRRGRGAVGERALAGQHDAVGAGDTRPGSAVTATSAAMPAALGRQRQRARGGCQIAAAVVDHRDLHPRSRAAQLRPARPAAAPAPSIRSRAATTWVEHIAAPCQRPAAQVAARTGLAAPRATRAAPRARRPARKRHDRTPTARASAAGIQARCAASQSGPKSSAPQLKPFAHQHRRPLRRADARSRMLTARPWSRGSRRRRAGPSSIAMRSARAVALKQASAMWCALRPARARDVQCQQARSSRTRGRTPRTARCPSRRSRRARRSTDQARNGRPERSIAASASASSIGTRAWPKRRMPRLSPSACASAWPSTMPTSSVVWWQVDVQVALGARPSDRAARGGRVRSACGRGSRSRSRSAPGRCRRVRARRGCRSRWWRGRRQRCGPCAQH